MLGLAGGLAKQAEKLTSQLYAAFAAKDMAMLEINPLIVSAEGQLKCLDAKISFDDNALYRHPEIAALRDESEENAKEIEASKHNLNYIALSGTIGCMVNGAGLAMATMDIIKLYGAVEVAQHPPDDGGGPLGDRRPPCCAGERQRSEEFTMVRKVDLVGQCETGATTPSVAKIASDPKRVDPLHQSSVQDELQIAPANGGCIDGVVVAAGLGVRIEDTVKSERGDFVDERIDV